MKKLLNLSLIGASLLVFSSIAFAQEQNQPSPQATPTVQSTNPVVVPVTPTPANHPGHHHDFHGKHHHGHHKHHKHGHRHHHHRHHWNHHGHHGYKNHENFHKTFGEIKALDLTHEQHEKIREIMKSEKESFKSVREEDINIHKSFSELKPSDPNYTAKSDELGNKISVVAKENFDHLQKVNKEIFDVLTPDQQAKADNNVLRGLAFVHSDFFHNHHWGHHNKHHKHGHHKCHGKYHHGHHKHGHHKHGHHKHGHKHGHCNHHHHRHHGKHHHESKDTQLAK